MQRINRALKPGREQLRKWRSGEHEGAYYQLDLQLNAVVRLEVDLEVLAKSLGVMEPWEAIAEE